MTANIHSILNDLGSTIEAAISTEKGRADAAETKLEAILAGMQMILANIAPPANDDDCSPELSGPATLAKSSPTSFRRKIADATFLDMLEPKWLTATQLRRKLIANGHAISEGAVYKRMREVAASYAQVEFAAGPERWRLAPSLVVPTGDGSNADQSASKKPRKFKAAARSKAVTASAPANENPPATIFPPVLIYGDCLDRMRDIPDASVDLILADNPYQISGHDYDKRIPMEPLWAEYRRIIKPTGNIVLFAQQPFTTALINAAPDLFKYDIVWEKNTTSGFQHARNKVLRSHEDILVFSPGVNQPEHRTRRRATYNPQGVERVIRVGKGRRPMGYMRSFVTGHEHGKEFIGLKNCPRSVLRFPKDRQPKGVKSHPYAKPLALLEYLIRTYSNEGETFLDNAMGSGSTMVAAMNTGRRGIGIEQDATWFALAKARIEAIRRASSIATGQERDAIASYVAKATSIAA